MELSAMSRAETAELIKLQFWMLSRVGPWNVLREVVDVPTGTALLVCLADWKLL